MSIFPDVSEEDLINLRKLAEPHKNQRALKIKNRILKQTRDVKLAESLSSITKKLDEEKETTQKIGDVIKESQQETPQPAIEHTLLPRPIENNEGLIYDVELENTLKNMTINNGFFKTYFDRERGWNWNGHTVKMIPGTEVKINDKVFNITPKLQKVFNQTSNIPLKKLNDQDWEIYKIFLETLNFKKYVPKSGENESGRYRYSKTNFKDRNLEGKRVKIIIPSNIIDLYTRLEISHGLKLSGHTDTLTEASALIDQLNKMGKIQNKQQYRNALNNFST